MADRINIKNLAPTQITVALAEMNEQRHRTRQIMQWIWQKGAASFDEMTSLSLDLRARLEERFRIPEMHVAYLRHIRPYQGDETLFERLFTKLFTWAGPRGLIQFPATKVISLYHDNPEITDESKLRTDVCITVPEDTPVEGEIGKATIPGGKYAVAHFELKDSSQYGAAWNAIYGGWLPESGYQPDDRPCFEHCLNNPKEDPEGKHIVDIYVAVKPL